MYNFTARLLRQTSIFVAWLTTGYSINWLLVLFKKKKRFNRGLDVQPKMRQFVRPHDGHFLLREMDRGKTSESEKKIVRSS